MGKTLLEEEKEQNKKIAEFEEELDVLGQDSEDKAAKAVIEKGKKNQKKEDKKRSDILAQLDDNRNKIFIYKDVFFQKFQEELEEYDIPKGFRWGVVKTDKGIVLYFTYQGRNFARGMTISNNPLYDMNCADRLIGKALDAMDKRALSV